MEMNDAIGILTKNNDYAKSRISAFLVFQDGRSKIQTLNCNEDCLDGVFQGHLKVINNLKQSSKCKVRFDIKQGKRSKIK